MLPPQGMLLSALLLGIVAATSSPTPHVHRYQTRQIKYDPSCEKDQYKAKVQTSIGDVATLANNINIDFNAFRQSNAYKHYFGDDDVQTVQSMFQVLYNDRIPADDQHSTSYTWNVKCGNGQSDACKNGQSFAVTDIRPDHPDMILCDKFFNSKEEEVNKNLDTKDKTSGRRGWCVADRDFTFFEVSALTMMHEMTHLHVIGDKAGLPEKEEDGFKFRGTEDVYTLGDASDKARYKRGNAQMLAWDASRQIMSYWIQHNADNKKYKPLAPATENAESYAAAALEWYFQKLCGFDEIKGAGPPLDGVALRLPLCVGRFCFPPGRP